MECYIGQVIEPTFGDKLTQLFFYCNILTKINKYVYNFNVCCQGEMRRRLVVQRHLCFERKGEITLLLTVY